MTDDTPLLLSLALFAAIGGLARVVLALDGNWPKALRVGAAIVAYVAVLLALRRRAGTGRWFAFAAAGAVAGLTSGLLHPSGMARVVFTQTVAGALLLGTLHWTTLRGSVRLRTHLTRAASDRSR